jgi:phosphoserine phosphatase RsbU/P
MFETVPYEQGSVVLAAGDALAVFSDGLSETLSPTDEEYGDDRIAATILARPQASATDLQDAILADLETFSAGARPSDDRTLLVLKREHGTAS